MNMTKLRFDSLNLNKQKGLSLVELMIALLLSSILMVGAVQVFIGSKTSFTFNEEMTWMQEGSRFGLEFLTRDARMAGYYGCGSQTVANTLNPVSGTGSWQYNFEQAIVGYDGDDPDFPADFPTAPQPTLATGALPKSDVVTILRGAAEDEALTVTGHNVNSAVITVNKAHGYSAGRILVISDCDHAAIFQTTGNNPNKLGHNKGGSVSPGNCTKGLGLPVVCTANGTAYKYEGDAFVMEVLSHAYYVDTAPNNVPSLYREEVSGGVDSDTEELTQGIENIQVVFGIDTNDDKLANRYVSALDVTDWSTVVSVRFHILARSLTQISSEAVSFRFVNNTYTPKDRFLRKEFISTVKIRNRGI